MKHVPDTVFIFSKYDVAICKTQSENMVVSSFYDQRTAFRLHDVRNLFKETWIVLGQ